MPRGLVMICALAGLMATGACGRRAPDPSGHHPDLAKELQILQSAIETIHGRYVDEDLVQNDQLIAYSLKGMIAAIDPYAEIIRNDDAPSLAPPPADAPLIEIKPVGENSFLAIRIYGFDPMIRRTLRSLEAAYRQEQPAGILLDVRDAVGEDYSMVAAIAEWFIPPDSVVGTVVEKQGEQQRILMTKKAALWATNSLVVLVDRETSGPAELLAAALRFYERGILVGEPTRGVAVVQSQFRLTDDWSVKLTTGRILDPDGRDMTGNPQQPDILAQPDPENLENIDWIYRRGITALRDQSFDPGLPPDQ